MSLRTAVMLVMLSALVTVQSALAADILVLTTRNAETTAQGGVGPLLNVETEFSNAATASGGTATINFTELVNGLPMDPSIFTNPVTGRAYNLVVVASVYKKIDAADWEVIDAAIKNRSASGFILLNDLCSGWPDANNSALPANCDNGGGVHNANVDKNGIYDLVTHAAAGVFTPTKGGLYSGLEYYGLNTQSSWQSSFSGMPVIAGGYYAAFSNVPADNILYKISGAADPSPNTTGSAYGLLVPNTQSYGGTGACVFAITDSSMFFGSASSQPYSVIAGKFGNAFVQAATNPTGACATVGQIRKGFAPSSIPVGGESILTINVDNLVGREATNLAIVDHLPLPLRVSSTTPITTTCSGAAPSVSTQNVGGTEADTVLLDHATLPAAGCKINVPVIWPNSAYAITACGAGTTLTNTITPLGRDGVVSTDDEFSVSGGAINTPAVATLSCNAAAYIDVTKSADPNVAVTPGGEISYTITVENKGLVSANNVSITDNPPADALETSSLNWTCTASNGASCPASIPSGNLHLSGLTIPAGGKLNLTLQARVTSVPPSSFTNTVSVNPGTGLCASGNGAPCTAQATLPPVGMISISKTTPSFGSPLLANSSVSYTVKVSNPGTVEAKNITVSDPLPAGMVSGTWRCTAGCGSSAGNLPLTDTITTLSAGSSVVYEITAQSADVLPTQVINTASATPQAPQVCEGGRTPPCNASVALTAAPQILVTKSSTAVEPIKPGSDIIYTITVVNTGGTPAIDLIVSDPIPAGLVGGTWRCSGTCGANLGNLPLTDSIPLLAIGSMATYTVTATVGANNLPQSIVNEVNVSSSARVSCSNGTAAPCRSRAMLKTFNRELALDIPTLQDSMLMLLAACLASLSIGAYRLEKRKKQ